MQKLENARIRKNNMKLHPIYQMIGFDLMFFYAIQILFLIQVKEMSASQAVLLGAFYAFFAMILNIPLTMLVSKIGKKNSMVLGNVFSLVYILMWIFCDSYFQFIVAEFFSAIAFALKGITESAFLNESIPNVKRKPEIFTKINGSGYSKFSYFSAVTMLFSGFLYDINPYIPLVCCAICILIAIIISANFIEVDKLLEPEQIEKKRTKSITATFNDLKSELKFIFKSKRLRALLLMTAAIWGLMCLSTSYRTTLLEDIGCSATFIGGFAAFLELAKGYFSTKANRFNKKHSNTTLTIIILTITIGMIVSGVVTLIGVPFAIQLAVIAVAFTAIYARKGIYQVIRTRYMNSFTTPAILTKLYSVDGITANMSRMIITFIGSSILATVNIKYAIIIVGILFTIVAFAISKYMKTRIGLKAEEYDKKDIKYEKQ